MSTYDVGIVGAGIHGVSAAYHLATSSVRVVVFDKGGAASGPTGRSSAVCRAYYTNEFLATMARDSLAMFEAFAQLTKGRDAGYRRTGALYLHPSGDLEHVSETTALLRELGIWTEILEPAELLRRFSFLSVDGVGFGVWEPGAGYADPARTTIGLLERAVELGAEARLNTPVRAIEPLDGGGATIVAEDGTSVRCATVLVAAGPWTRSLLAPLGVELPLTVERHIVATYKWGGAEPIPFVIADLVGGYYCKPEGEDVFGLGPLLAAPEVDPDDFPEEITDAESVELAQAVVRRIPALQEAEARGGWASLYDMSPDSQPVIGEVAPGIFVDAGTSGHGFKVAPALGRHVAGLVLGKPGNGLEQFHPSRFAEGRLLSAGYGDIKILG